MNIRSAFWLKLASFAKFIFGNFGPLVIFYGLNHLVGLKPAIFISVLFTLCEIVYLRYAQKPITKIFIFTAGLTFVFGMVDLYAERSFLFQYEASVSSIFMGVFFGYSLFAKKTVIQEYYEKKPGAKPMTPDRVAYFRGLTAVWVAYFLLKAWAYFWVANHYSLEQGLLIRTLLGTVSLYLLLFLSIFGSKKFFPLLKKWNWLPNAENA